ncbi:TIGR02117 family protein [Sphingobacterium bovistauri]|uniref:TIGR02117 family protein n=1 Tax=Sphingobacterium bovistauri TaxID=2781959 RepID=A0ABS7Z2R0_9SPHI|nr:TIGR02117 family protein [Sphingobacterium bovistauri]MCA5004438.1 TIGR02117 family protein [Sphingobacterium bovistauri]
MKYIKMFILYPILAILLFAVIYFAIEAILSRIPADAKAKFSNDKSYTVYLLSNDVHTDVVFPVKSDLVDWRDTFPISDIKSKDSTYNWVGIGWGDKGFYLNTPEWKDLTAKTALVAAIGIGETALHVTYHHQMQEGKLCYKIEIDKEQYQQLINHVLESLETKGDNKPIYIETTAQYGDSDAFYEALGSYSMFYSCNTWTNEALKKANLPSGIWTVFDKGILRWYGYK